MTTSTIITLPNPYRESSKLHSIFRFLSDGVPHTLDEITNAVYSRTIALFRYRTASAIRTIRNRRDFSVEFKDGKYQLFESKVSIQALLSTSMYPF